MEFHPVASIFPMMSVEEFKALKESIAARGQRNPIYTHENKIVDGRNRYQACVELGIKPWFEKWDSKGLLVDFVWDLNINRRQLNGGALKLAAGKYAIAHKEEAKERSGARTDLTSVSFDTEVEFGRSREKAAEKFKVAPATVQRAVAVLNHGAPELAQAVESGQITVNRAADIVKKYPDKEQQRAQLAQGFTKEESNGAIKVLGVGVDRAHDAINCLRRIPKNDGLRKRGFQIVADWIKQNQ